MFAALQSAEVSSYLQDTERHLIPRQFAWSRAESDTATAPQMIVREDKTILYQFKPQMASAERFEKIGEGPGYIWGFGSGFLEYTVPARADRRKVSEIIVRAHIQPVLPVDAPPGFVKTRVTLFVEGWNGGSRLIPVEPLGQPIQRGEQALISGVVRVLGSGETAAGRQLCRSLHASTYLDYPADKDTFVHHRGADGRRVGRRRASGRSPVAQSAGWLRCCSV